MPVRAQPAPRGDNDRYNNSRYKQSDCDWTEYPQNNLSDKGDASFHMGMNPALNWAIMKCDGATYPICFCQLISSFARFLCICRYHQLSLVELWIRAVMMAMRQSCSWSLENRSMSRLRSNLPTPLEARASHNQVFRTYPNRVQRCQDIL